MVKKFLNISAGCQMMAARRPQGEATNKVPICSWLGINGSGNGGLGYCSDLIQPMFFFDVSGGCIYNFGKFRSPSALGSGRARGWEPGLFWRERELCGILAPGRGLVFATKIVSVQVLAAVSGG